MILLWCSGWQESGESTSGDRIGNVVAKRVDIKISHHKKTEL